MPRSDEEISTDESEMTSEMIAAGTDVVLSALGDRNCLSGYFSGRGSSRAGLSGHGYDAKLGALSAFSTNSRRQCAPIFKFPNSASTSPVAMMYG
jgi:hypothetical protein